MSKESSIESKVGDINGSIFSKLLDHLHLKDGFCYPNWAAIGKYIEEGFSENQWGEAWEAVSRVWVDRIREALDGAYRTYETESFLILSEAPERVARDASRSFENSLKEILAKLANVTSDEGYGKHVVLMFASVDDYYSYISYFYPDGEHPMSGGVFLSGEGYVHFAFPTADYSSYKTVLVHELTHGCLGHLPVPAWLNEALAMRMEETICGSDIFYLDREIFEKHVAHWDDATIQQFWTGESWEIPGDSFDLSYNLAQVLWRKIETDLGASRSAILEFASKANVKDAGEDACRLILGLSLGEIVADFLGDGRWAPDPAKWPSERA